MAAAATRAMLALSEVTVTFNLGYLMRCADAMEGLKMFSVPLTHTADLDSKLIPALARLPSQRPCAAVSDRGKGQDTRHAVR